MHGKTSLLISHMSVLSNKTSWNEALEFKGPPKFYVDEQIIFNFKKIVHFGRRQPLFSSLVEVEQLPNILLQNR
mgnify:CR=1 FL=1